MKRQLFYALAAMAAFLPVSCASTSKAGADSTSPFEKVGLNGSEVPYTVLAKTNDGVEIQNGGYGSDACAHPTDSSLFYLVTDRGPNIDFKGNSGKGKMFPVSSYAPRIGLFKMNKDGSVSLVKEITLKSPDGKEITGLPNPNGKGATGEIAYDLDGNILGTDEYGLDSEGIVALKDGTFWISDEYGPHIVHYDADGKQIERISPFGMDTGKRHLPAVLARRRANRGMEGLAITPDEKTLVGIMQSTLFNPSKKEISNKQLVRIVTFDIKTGSTKQYAYIQNKETDSTCGITVLSNTEFVVIERDGKFSGEKEAHKYLFKIDLKDATDITGENPESKEGLLINGKTLEQCTTEEIEAAGIKPVKKEFLVDLVEYLPNKYPHDKLEGLWVLDSNTIAVANDNDFAINVENNQLVQKKLPGTGRIDNDVIYVIKLPRSLR